jgi:hypothetical protein
MTQFSAWMRSLYELCRRGLVAVLGHGTPFGGSIETGAQRPKAGSVGTR